MVEAMVSRARIDVLTGSLAGQSATTGTLTIRHPLAGTLTGQSTLTGSIRVLRPLAGTLAAVSTLTGSLTNQGPVTAVGRLEGGLTVSLPTATQGAQAPAESGGTVTGNESTSGVTALNE